MSADPKSLLNRGMSLIDREMKMLEQASQENGRLLTTQREDLCAYMGVLHKLVGKDLGGEENLSEFSDAELLGIVTSHVGNSPNQGRKSKSSKNAA